VLTLGGQSLLQPSLSTLEEVGIFQAVGHLVAGHGRKRLALLAGPEDSYDTRQRLLVFEGAAASFKTASVAWTIKSASSFTAGREAIRELLARPGERFDAVVAASDELALGAISGLQQANLNVPRDVSVIGFGDIAESPIGSPSLSTIRPPCSDYGERAANQLLEPLDGDAESPWELPSAASVRVLLRESCGCRPLAPKAGGAPEDRLLIDDAIRRLLNRHLTIERRRAEMAPTLERLVNAENFSEIARVLTEVREIFELQRLSVCLYSTDKRRFRVAFSSDNGPVVAHSRAPRSPIDTAFSSTSGGGAAAGFTYVAPLVLASERLGYLAIESDFTIAEEACRLLDLPRALSVALSRASFGRELARLYDIERRWLALHPDLRLSEGEHSSTKLLAAPPSAAKHRP
jgi:hypothetical protein